MSPGFWFFGIQRAATVCRSSARLDAATHMRHDAGSLIDCAHCGTPRNCRRAGTERLRRRHHARCRHLPAAVRCYLSTDAVRLPVAGGDDLPATADGPHMRPFADSYRRSHIVEHSEVCIHPSRRSHASSVRGDPDSSTRLFPRRMRRATKAKVRAKVWIS